MSDEDKTGKPLGWELPKGASLLSATNNPPVEHALGALQELLRNGPTTAVVLHVVNAQGLIEARVFGTVAPATVLVMAALLQDGALKVLLANSIPR